MKIFKSYKKTLGILFFVILFLVIQIVAEVAIQAILNDNIIRLSFSFLFIINLSVLIFFGSRRFFFFSQSIPIMFYLFVMLPHVYYFNIFSFFSRINYFWSSFRLFAYIVIITVALISFVFLFSSTQLYLYKNIQDRKKIFLYFILIILFVKVVFPPITYEKYLITYINQNRLGEALLDFKRFKNGKYKIQEYNCDRLFNKSPSVRFFYDTSTKRELLLIIESWGKLIDSSVQNQFFNDLMLSHMRMSKLSKTHQINFQYACFNGNTASAEGRELLNFNDEESYQAFLDNGIRSKWDVIDFKKSSGYSTISGTSCSRMYGSTWGNVELFRRRLGFDKRVYYEDLIQSNNENNENSYVSIRDEKMLDYLIKISQKESKVFVYGLTINTHLPFKLDTSFVDKKDYNNIKEVYYKGFKERKDSFDQFYRIRMLINYLFKKLETIGNPFDKILIIGDHPPPGNGFVDLYDQSEVPYIRISRIKN